MPLQVPSLADRNYQQLLDESLARIPIHNPEWTNFNKSDPGVTLIEVFAFLTENLLYRSNQIPERNRKKFLSLLGVPLQPATPARGLVTFSNEAPEPKTVTLNDGLEVRAGAVPFRTEQGLDVLPIEARSYYKRVLENPPAELVAYYEQLYASYQDAPPLPPNFQLYETVPFATQGETGIDLGSKAIDGSLWIALLLRANDKPSENTDRGWEALKNGVRAELAGKTVNLGMVPAPGDAGRQLPPGILASPESEPLWQFHIPVVPANGLLSANPAERVPVYKALDAIVPPNIVAEPGVAQVTLPKAEELILWKNLEPLEAGVGDFPPALEDTAVADRVLTWLRVTPRAHVPGAATTKVQAQLLWAGINTASVTQRAHVGNELLPEGTGEPDQVDVLAKRPVLPGSVRLTVTNGKTTAWSEIEDLLNAEPEVPVPDPRQPPGRANPSNGKPNGYQADSAQTQQPSAGPAEPNPGARVFALNAEAGEIRFGYGARGARPPRGAILRADYDYGLGRAGNVRAGSINSGPALPEGIKVSNPIRTWGGADAESVAEGEKQITRYLQHRDRLVNAVDFETITLRTPGVDVGRVDVLPAFNPELSGNAPGDAPGAVTLMVIPAYDAARPDAPVPDQLFLDTICAYLNPRRLVTTEVFLRGPDYKRIWVTVGIEIVSGFSVAVVREAVKKALSAFLSPLPRSPADLLDAQTAVLTAPQHAQRNRGWPLCKPVIDLELLAEASRVPGVAFVNGVIIAPEGSGPQPRIPLVGLELPWLVGIAVGVGDPPDVELLRGQASPALDPPLMPVPVVPEEC